MPGSIAGGRGGRAAGLLAAVASALAPALPAAGQDGPAPPADVLALFTQCLPPAWFEPSLRLDPAWLEPDLDGDGVRELVLPVRRVADRKEGLAVCRADGTLVGIPGLAGTLGIHLVPAYFDRMDWWGIHAGPVGQGMGEGPPPALAGEALLLGREESSSVLLTWTAAGFSSYWQGD